MKAVLTTLCGCKREMTVPYPPNRDILVPLRNDRFRVWFDESTPPTHTEFRVRRFELRGYSGGHYGTAEYMERE